LLDVDEQPRGSTGAPWTPPMPSAGVGGPAPR